MTGAGDREGVWEGRRVRSSLTVLHAEVKGESWISSRQGGEGDQKGLRSSNREEEEKIWRAFRWGRKTSALAWGAAL